ncbi:hypothetical protein GCM10010429_57270 [Micromonospora olivasterospora]
MLNAFRQPVAHGDSAVDRVPVHDQVDLPPEVNNPEDPEDHVRRRVMPDIR